MDRHHKRFHRRSYYFVLHVCSHRAITDTLGCRNCIMSYQKILHFFMDYRLLLGMNMATFIYLIATNSPTAKMFEWQWWRPSVQNVWKTPMKALWLKCLIDTNDGLVTEMLKWHWWKKSGGQNVWMRLVKTMWLNCFELPWWRPCGWNVLNDHDEDLLVEMFWMTLMKALWSKRLTYNGEDLLAEMLSNIKLGKHRQPKVKVMSVCSCFQRHRINKSLVT